MCKPNELCRDTAPEIQNWIEKRTRILINWNAELEEPHVDEFHNMIEWRLVLFVGDHYYPNFTLLQFAKIDSELRKTLGAN